MTTPPSISTYISRLALSLALLAASLQAPAQGKVFAVEKDSVPLFQGVAIAVDIAGPIVRALSDYGEIEVAARVNLHNQYYPVVEIGYGSAKHEEDAITGLSYKTNAPYFRIGCDVNLLKRKHTGNRLFLGLRYGYTSYKVDLARAATPDPVWQWDTYFSATGEACNQHWLEIVFGLDTKVFGPIHAGWDVRYRRRLAHKDTSIGRTWYIPGFGRYGGTRIGAHFNIIIDI